VNWKVRFTVIVVAAAALYGVMVWALGRQLPARAATLAGRVETLEALAASPPLAQSDRAALVALLARQPEAGAEWLGRWSPPQLVAALGWPDRVGAQQWWYTSLSGPKKVLEVSWVPVPLAERSHGLDSRVERTQWLDHIPEVTPGESNH